MAHHAAATKAAVATAAPTVAATPTPAQIAATATQAVLTTTATAPTPTPIPVPAGVRVPADDPTIEAGPVTFPGDGLTLMGYQAKPKGNGPFPAIIVAHENRGLTDYIMDVTRRLAKAGYVALAVDQLSKQGGTAKVTDPAQIPAALSGASPDELAGYYLSGIKYLQGLPIVQRDQLGMVGFCFGGGMTWLTATKSPDLKAAVPFYGPNPPLEAVPNIKAAVLAMYGGDRPAHRRGHPGHRRGDEEEQQGLREDDLSRRGPCFPQRHRARLQPGGRRRRVEAHAGVVREVCQRLRSRIANGSE